jgi:hypothetical protein
MPPAVRAQFRVARSIPHCAISRRPWTGYTSSDGLPAANVLDQHTRTDPPFHNGAYSNLGAAFGSPEQRAIAAHTGQRELQQQATVIRNTAV